ncbi:MAG: transporter substrate-binding domain-containing protein [Sphaerochaetaceae bacterium]|nr:transporter substrate-binding domain-containing protein [Sphaerochaetaceae bacterium]
MKKRYVRMVLVVIVMISSLSNVFASEESDYVVKDLTLDDLNGKVVGVQTGCLYETHLLKRCPDVNIEFFADPSTMILALKQGKLFAMLTESNSYLCERRFHPGLKYIEEVLEKIDCAVMFSPSGRQEKLREEMNAFIAEYINSGEREDMEDYWLDNSDLDSCVVDRSGITGENGKLVVAVESGYEPFSFVSKGEVSGFDVDFVYRFARKYGYSPEFYLTTFDALSAAVASGKADLGMNVVLSDERSDGAIFSDPYNTYNLIATVYEKSENKESFFEKTGNSFYKTFVKESRYELFLYGMYVTLIICILSIVIGTVAGLLLYLLLRERIKALTRFTELFGWVIHAMPTVLFLMILSYVVFASAKLNGIIVSVIGFSVLFCFTMYDLIVSGVKAVGKGQYEAARAQGFTDKSTFFLIQNPQAISHFLPAYKGEVISIIKDSSIVGYIAVMDLTKISDIVRSRTYEAFFPLITTALIYFLIMALLIFAVNKVGLPFDKTKRKTKKILKGIDVSKYGDYLEKIGKLPSIF